MIPKHLHFIWVGSDAPPATLDRSRESWLRHHPGWEVTLWRDTDLTWLRNKMLFDRASSNAQKADIARYEILNRYGGIYVDADMECLKPIDTLCADLEFFAGREPSGSTAIGLIGARPEHPLLREIIDRLPWSCLLNRSINSQTGPGLFDRVISTGHWEQQRGVRIFPPAFFYPYDLTEPSRKGKTFPTAYAVHHWQHSWDNAHGVTVTYNDLRIAAVRGAVDASLYFAADLRTRLGYEVTLRLVSPAKRRLRKYLVRLGTIMFQPLAGVPFGEGRLLIRGPMEIRLLCSTDDISLSPELAISGVYDSSFVAFLMRGLRPGMTFVDVGANVGLFTIIAARLVGRGGRVFSYECNPSLLALLNRNVAMNWYRDRVVVVPKAASDSNGEAEFYAPVELMGLGVLAEAQEGEDLASEAEAIIVETECLDARLADIGFVDLVKIDVEGAEAKVLDGMKKIIGKQGVGMLSLEFRADVTDNRVSRAMELQLAQFASQDATFHEPGRLHAVPLDEVLTVAHYSQLIVRFPWSSIPIEALG
jgi:FkbM family methyltransferase